MPSLPLHRNPWIVASLGTLVMGTVMLLADQILANDGSFWSDWVTEPSTVNYFCEPGSLEAFFRQKVATYTNLGFFFMGALVLAFAGSDRRHATGGFVGTHPEWSIAFGIALWMAFAGSTLFHASLTRSGEALDLAGTYAAALLPGFFNVHRLLSAWLRRQLPFWPFILAGIVIWLVSSLLIFRLSSRVVVPSGLLLIGISGFLLWLQLRPRRGWGWAALAMLLTVLAATFFVMDIEKIGCEPSSWYQAHGVWHLLAACAAGSYYGFMRRIGTLPQAQ